MRRDWSRGPHVRFAKSLAKLLHAVAQTTPAATPREIIEGAAKPLHDDMRSEIASLVNFYYKIRWGKAAATEAEDPESDRQHSEAEKSLSR